MIRTLIFDLGGVIVPLDFPRGYAALSRLCGIPPEEIPKVIAPTGLVFQLETGQIEPREFHRRISALLGLSLSFGEFVSVWSVIFPPWTLIPPHVLDSLRRRYRLLLLSNTNAIHFPYVLARHPVLRRFDGLILSYEVGRMKPAGEIYRAALMRAGCAAAECLFIDDMSFNVAGARCAGIDAIRFTSLFQLTADLRSRGVQL